jgi:tRNA threonylcarbamoyladenosine biosynthesis protein TsaE
MEYNLAIEEYTTTTPQETESLAKSFALVLKPGAIVALYGDLGAGKTCWVRGLAQGLAVKNSVTSPTFTLIQEYSGKVPLYHFDLYRLKNASELEDIGFEEYFYSSGITAVEWAEKAGQLMPPVHWEVRFHNLEANTRRIQIKAVGFKGDVE